MALVLRRPGRATKTTMARRGYADGGVVSYSDPNEDRHDRYDPLTGKLKDPPRPAPRPTPAPQPRRSIPAHVLEAASDDFARGGSVGLPRSPFAAAALPTVATPGLASPRAMMGAHHRQRFAAGGSTLPPHVVAALHVLDQHRGHFADGGDVPFDPESGDVPGAALVDGQASPTPAAPAPFWGSPASIPATMPSAARASQSGPRTTMLQTGFDPNAVAKFWGGLGGDDTTPLGQSGRAVPQQHPGTTPAVGRALPAAPAPTPIYNPMADPVVRNSLHMAHGGAARSTLPPHVERALAILDEHRRHFEDGGSAGGGDGGGDSSSSSSGGDSDGGSSSSSGGYGSSSSSSSSGGYGGVGGFGGNSDGSDGYGGSSSTSSTSSGSSGGVGGFGGMSGGSDGYGGSNSVSSSSSSSGGFGGHSDASTSGGYGSTAGGSSSSGSYGSASSGSNSDGGSDGGFGGAVGGGSATSGDVGSIGGSFGAPAAGGFSTSGAETGGFGSFGATPAAKSNPAGLSGGLGSASSLSGQTAAQSASSEAASGGDPGEDGTTSAGSTPTTAQAFASFGPAPSAPFGSMANVESTFGAPSGLPSSVQAALAASSVPSSVAMSNPAGAADLSPSGAMFSAMGVNGMDPGFAGPIQAAIQAHAAPAAGLSDGRTPGFDNFNSAPGVSSFDSAARGDVTSSSFGADGYTGGYGMQPAINGALNGPEGYVGSPAGLSTAPPAGVAEMPAPSAAATSSPAPASDTSTAARLGSMFGDIGDGFSAVHAAGTVGQPSAPSPTGLNADGDPVAVDGTSALTIHGNLSPSAAMMADGTPTPNLFGSQPAMRGPDATQAQHQYRGTELSRDAGVGTFGADFDGSGLAQVQSYNTSFGTPSASPTITDSQVFGAQQRLINGTGTPADRDLIVAYHAQQATPSGTVAGPTEAAAPTPSTVPGLPTGSVFASLHQIEGGVLNGQPDPNNPAHYGPAQFDQPTFSDTVANHPELGIGTGLSMFNAREPQYAAVTQAHWGDIQSALQAHGIDPTPGNTYAGWNLGITGAIRAISAGPNASLADAGISAAVQRANPSIYGGVATVGQLQAKLDSKFSGATAGGLPASVAQAASPSFANFSPGAASGMDTTDTAAPATGVGISPPSTYTSGVASPTTQTVSAPSAYAGTADEASTLNAGGYEASPTNAYAVHTLGPEAAYAAVSLPGDTPIGEAGIAPDVQRANPGLFSGVRTVGDLRSNIAAAAATAGPATTSTVTTPGEATAGALPGYSFSSGAASGLDSVDTSAASFGISPPDTYAAPPTVSGMPGTPSTPTTTPSTTAPDAPAPAHLSVNPKVANIAANAGLSIFGGPIGAGIAGINGISGLLGGPTIGDGINGILAGSQGGTPNAIGGQGDNSSAGYRGARGSDGSAPIARGGSGDAAAPAATGVSPYDPHAAAMAAYQAALAGQGTGAGLSDAPAPLTVHPRRLPATAPTPIYRPMEDPIVRRALGLD